MPMIGRRIYPGMKRAAWGFMQSGDFPVPVAYWKFGENTGVKAYDSSPYGNTATLFGATWAKGSLGPGLSFDGIDNYARVKYSDSLNTTLSALTILARGTFRSLAATRHSVINRYSDRTRLSFDADRYVRASITADAGVGVRSSIAYSLNTWIDMAVTYDKDAGENNFKLYIQGKLDDQDTGTGNIVGLNARWYIGLRGGTVYPADGILDEILIFNEALTAAWIRQWSQGYR